MLRYCITAGDHRNASDLFLKTPNYWPKKRGHMDCLVTADYDESKGRNNSERKASMLAICL